jgi:hypothetical protein
LRTIASAPSVDHPAERAAGAPALAEDRGTRPSRERGAAGRGGPDATTRRRADRVREPLARRVDAAERHLQAAADERVGELADEALDAAGSGEALAQQEHVGRRRHRRSGPRLRRSRRRRRPARSRAPAAQAALAQARQRSRAPRRVEQAERGERARRAAPAASTAPAGLLQPLACA